MENGKKRAKHEWKNVFVGKNPDTGQSYFERRKVVVRNPNDLPEEPPGMDVLPLVDSKGNTLKEWQPLLIDPKKD